jgi:hypothetical protein
MRVNAHAARCRPSLGIYLPNATSSRCASLTPAFCNCSRMIGALATTYAASIVTFPAGWLCAPYCSPQGVHDRGVSLPAECNEDHRWDRHHRVQPTIRLRPAVWMEPGRTQECGQNGSVLTALLGGLLLDRLLWLRRSREHPAYYVAGSSFGGGLGHGRSIGSEATVYNLDECRGGTSSEENYTT